jgi:hypothetical protein
VIDIVVGSTYRINKLNKNNKSRIKKVFRGRIVGIRKARKKQNLHKKRDIDGQNAKAFIIVVDNDVNMEELVNKRVEIRII